jgi:hypothetical protein
MTTLHDRLDDAVADVHADLPTLTAASRNQGLGIRRRRRALASVGTAAVVTVTAAVGLPLVSGGDDPVAADIANPVRVGALSGRTAPATDEAVAAALVDAVDQVADGTYGRLQGEVFNHESLAAVLFAPATGTDGPPGQVFVNLQPASMSGERPYGCESWMTDCTVRDRADGTTLRTYSELDDTEFGKGSERDVAELIDPERRLRVVVFAMNTNPWDTGSYRDEPVLSTDQLVEIATMPWWGRMELPAEYVEAGGGLELFEG